MQERSFLRDCCEDQSPDKQSSCGVIIGFIFSYNGKMSRMKSKLIFVSAVLLLLSGCGIISVGHNYQEGTLK